MCCINHRLQFEDGFIPANDEREGENVQIALSSCVGEYRIADSHFSKNFPSKERSRVWA